MQHIGDNEKKVFSSVLFPIGPLREDAHKKVVYLVVGPLRGQGWSKTPITTKKKTFFSIIKNDQHLMNHYALGREGGYPDLSGPTTIF